MQDFREFRIQLLARPDRDAGALGRLEAFAKLAVFAVEIAKVRENRMAEGKCPLCGETITPGDFDTLSVSYQEEFNISGLCPFCQDEVFAEEWGEEE